MPEPQSNRSDQTAGDASTERMTIAPMLLNGHTETKPRGERRSPLVRAVLIGSLLGLSWIGMQAVHELGHVAAAWASGGTVVRVVVHPLTVSQTVVRPNPRRAIVAWSGPVGGMLLPLAAWGFASWLRFDSTYLWRFFAGFCLVANGAYLGIGSLASLGDAQVLLRHAQPPIALVLLGVLGVVAGLGLWHGESPQFGGRGAAVNPRHAAVLLASWVVVVVALLLAPT